jgi:hypothetical protein
MTDAERGNDGATARIQRVADLIDDFETPYVLELPAAVHWVVVQEGEVTFADTVEQVPAWNRPKGEGDAASHLRVAWQRLIEQGWIATSAASPSRLR